MILEIKKGDLLKATEKYLAQQNNCNTIKAHGLSQTIKDKYPWADPYGRRKKKSNNSTSEPDTPGTVLEMSDEKSYHTVLCLMAQWLPGSPYKFAKYYSNTFDDSYENRKKWFQQCLDILDEKYHEPIAMPYNIGCGLAGGDWKDYEEMLKKAKSKFVLYRI